MNLRKLCFLFNLGISICGAAEIAEENAVKRIHGHLFIQDPYTAVKDAQNYLKLYPESLNLQLAYLKALCQKGEEVEAFEHFLSIFKTAETQTTSDRITLEWLAWGVLNKGEGSPLLVVRLYSLLGAAFTRDARAISILLKELQGSNSILRSLAVKLSAQYGDAPLRKELLRLLKEEKIWFVKLDVIQAIGALKMVEAKGALQKIITSSTALAEEKASAIIALTGMYEKTTVEELSFLVNSKRAGLRHLAAEIVAHLDYREGVDILRPLLSDSSPNVRIAVMKVLGLLQVRTLEGKQTVDLLKKNMSDSHPEVSIMAGWLATVLGSKEGLSVLEKWIDQDRPEYQRLASAALASCGVSGVELSIKKLNEDLDAYTKVNLAIGLIGLRQEVARSSEILAESLDSNEELWMWDVGANGFFRTLSPSRVHHREGMPQYPQMVDHLVKLDILSILSIVKYPKAQDSVKKFLKNQAWGVTAAAASTLLQEGDESSLEVVRELLEDTDEKVRMQAALILAMLGSDPSAVKVLIEIYPRVDREMKMHILEALGRIGESSSIPFLVDLLKEPFQGVRVVAASALIQCLYH